MIYVTTFNIRYLQLGVGKQAGPPHVRPARISLYWQRTGLTRLAFLHRPNKLICSSSMDPTGQMGQSAGLVLKEF